MCFYLFESSIRSPGSQEADQVLRVLLETGIFIAGVLGFLLDNTIPGWRLQ